MTDTKAAILTILSERGPMTCREITEVIYPDLGGTDITRRMVTVSKALRRLTKWERVEVCGSSTNVRNSPVKAYGIKVSVTDGRQSPRTSEGCADIPDETS